jgi:hypothetical protein
MPCKEPILYAAPDQIERNRTPPDVIPNVFGVCLNRGSLYILPQDHAGEGV